ncbi:MAG: hypothetical protein FWE04_01590 [Oscillospiraceae bacterium]|nr:hypothetical protein [Oscillospiraceae bacterium]
MSKAERLHTIKQEQRAYYENKGEEVVEVSVAECYGKDRLGFREYIVVVILNACQFYAFSVNRKLG